MAARWVGDAVAVKRVIVDRNDDEQVALVDEISVMRSLPAHPNIVELIGTCSRKRGPPARRKPFCCSSIALKLPPTLACQLSLALGLPCCDNRTRTCNLSPDVHPGPGTAAVAHSPSGCSCDLSAAFCSPRRSAGSVPRHGGKRPSICRSVAALAHRDVKPENFIFSEVDGRWRLDFGSATTESFQ